MNKAKKWYLPIDSFIAKTVSSKRRYKVTTKREVRGTCKPRASRAAKLYIRAEGPSSGELGKIKRDRYIVMPPK